MSPPGGLIVFSLFCHCSQNDSLRENFKALKTEKQTGNQDALAAKPGLWLRVFSLPLLGSIEMWFLWSGSTRVDNFTKMSRKLLPELWCIASWDKPPEKNLPSKNTVSSTCNVGFYLRDLQIAAFCILISYFMESKLKKIPIDSWRLVNAVIIETVKALKTRCSIIRSGSNVIFWTQSLSPCHLTRNNRYTITYGVTEKTRK